jgi:hypothetical protein
MNATEVVNEWNVYINTLLGALIILGAPKTTRR